VADSRRRDTAKAPGLGRAHGAQAHQVKTERPAASAFLPAHDRGIPTCATTHARMPLCQDSLLDLAETKSAPPPARKAAVSQESPALWGTRGFPAPTSMYYSPTEPRPFQESRRGNARRPAPPRRNSRSFATSHFARARGAQLMRGPVVRPDLEDAPPTRDEIEEQSLHSQRAAKHGRRPRCPRCRPIERRFRCTELFLLDYPAQLVKRAAVRFEAVNAGPQCRHSPPPSCGWESQSRLPPRPRRRC
jgi:hypothetical protein